MKLSGKLSMGIAGAVLAGVLVTGIPAGVFAAQEVAAPVQNVQCHRDHRGMHAGNFAKMNDAVAKFIGIDANTLKTERQSGKSLVQIAEANGKTESDLFNYIYSLHKSQTDQLIKDGKITQEQADKHDSKMQEMVKKMINDTHVGRPHDKGQFAKGFKNGMDSVAKFIGIDANTIKAERQSGKSLVQIAEARGKSEADLLNYMYDLSKTHVDQLVKDGKITQEQADKRLANMKDRISKMINNTQVGHNWKGQGPAAQ